MRVGDKQDKFVLKTDEVATPSNTVYPEYNGDLSCHSKTKNENTCRLKCQLNKCPIQPDFYLPDGKGSRLSEVHQIKTTEKSPEGHPAVLLAVENLRAKYNTKYFLLDRYLGYLYAAGGETIGSDPIEKKDGYILLSQLDP